MDEQIFENIPTLPPHQYPTWVKLFGVGIIIAAIYPLILLPKYWVAAKKMRAAVIAHKSGDNDQAIKLYLSVLEAMPTAKAARIGAVEAIFSNSDKEDDEVGLNLLRGRTLDKNDWRRIKWVMPVEYQQYFDEVKQ